jgi:hypothetical protein
MTAIEHRITISCEGPSRSGALVLNGGHRAHCSCGWSSDCYAQMRDFNRAVEVHLRRSQHVHINALITKLSVGAAITDVKARPATRHVRSKV